MNTSDFSFIDGDEVYTAETPAKDNDNDNDTDAPKDPYHGIFSGQFDLIDGDEVPRRS